MIHAFFIRNTSTKVYSESCNISKTYLFAKVVNGPLFSPTVPSQMFARVLKTLQKSKCILKTTENQANFKLHFNAGP